MRLRNRTIVFSCCLATLSCGCAAKIAVPMPERLSLERQTAMDDGWTHLVAHHSTASREALMDAILLHQAWQRGVDSLRLTTEKQVGDVRVRMQSRFDRDAPDADEFRVDFIAADGWVLRSESISGHEMDAALQLYLAQTPPMSVDPNELSPLDATLRDALYAERERRIGTAASLFPIAQTEAAAETAPSAEMMRMPEPQR